MTTIASSVARKQHPQQVYRRRPGLLRKMVYAVARLGWGILGDIGMLLRIAAGIAIAGAPLFLARFLTDYVHIGAKAPGEPVPFAYLLAAQGVALMLSGWILIRLFLRSSKDKP